MKFKEHDIVKTTEPIGNIPAYTKGVIVHIYDKKNFAVEFFDDKKNTIYEVATVNKKDLVKEESKLQIAISLLAGAVGMAYTLHKGQEVFASLFLAMIMITNYIWLREQYTKLTGHKGFFVIPIFILMWAVLQTLLLLAVTYLK